MPSDLIVEVTKIVNVYPHDNADKLELAQIKGWQVVVGKDTFKAGDLIVYFPPDCLVPRNLAITLGVDEYLSYSSSRYDGLGRVRSIKLRKKVSYGFAAPITAFPESLLRGHLKEGTDVAEILGVEKWEPPVRTNSGGGNKGQARKQNPFFPKYTHIQNIRNFPRHFNEDDYVIISEKIHGCLHKDSLVLLNDGNEKPISQVKKNDIVVSYDTKKKEYTKAKVQDVLIQEKTDKLEWFKLKFDNNRSLICTEDHPILTTEGWIQAKDLTENHIII